jgi:hypothetical protein
MNLPGEQDDLILEEIAAAAMHLAMVSTDFPDPLPANLRARIIESGEQLVEERQATEMNRESANSPVPSLPDTVRTDRSSSRRLSLVTWSGWLVATAAVTLLFFRPAGTFPAPTETTMVDARNALLSLPGTTRISWAPGPHPFVDVVKGEVVWNQERQNGFLVFQGLPKNDPAKEQYQLWIIDPGRDEEPIDGGVFDGDGNLETIVPIVAKLATVRPQAFAVTVEQPGGVVVSTQERLPLLAAVP